MFFQKVAGEQEHSAAAPLHRGSYVVSRGGRGSAVRASASRFEISEVEHASGF